MDALVVIVPLMPLLAAVLIGLHVLFEPLLGKAKEGFTALISYWAISMACLLVLTLVWADLFDKNKGEFKVGTWFTSDNFQPELGFTTSGFAIHLCLIFALLLLIIIKFSVNYMHKETGFHRFFFMINLYSSAIFLLVLSSNALVTFVGWEIVGLCSYWLIAYAYDRKTASMNAVFVFVVNRIGDAAFILGIALSSIWLESVNWAVINTADTQLDKGEAAVIALCFVFTGLAKSALMPFSPWLIRALEGPTPSSAAFYGTVMIHAGIFLIIQLEPLISDSPIASWLLIMSGITTVLYGYLCGLTQTDIKSSYAFAKHGQLGLMALECGLGFWELARWHLCAHAVVRCYLVLTAPSFMHSVKGVPVQRGVIPILASSHRVFLFALQRFWFDQIYDWALVRPIKRLARDLSYFDDNIIDKVMGVPVPIINSTAKLAQREDAAITPEFDHNHLVKNTGIVGKVMGWLAGFVHWFEDRLVLEGIAKDSLHAGRALGHLANKFEVLILRPRYLVLFVFITFLVAF